MLNPGCHTQQDREGDGRVSTDNTRSSRWKLHTLHRARTASSVAHQSVGLKVSVVDNEEAGVGAATDITGDLLGSNCVSEKLHLAPHHALQRRNKVCESRFARAHLDRRWWAFRRLK